MSDLLTRIVISDKPVIYRELKLKQYKNLLKCLIGDSIDTQNLFINLNSILLSITNLTEDDLLDFNLLEYFLLLTEIRVTSLGSSIFAIYKQSNNSMNIEIPLRKTIKNLHYCIKKTQPIKIIEDNTHLTFRVPKINDIINEKEFPFVQEDVNNLPARYLKVINKNSKLLNQRIKNFYFFDAPIKKYSINFSTKKNEYTQLIKILFNESLISIYNNIFYLSKICNISADYLENGTYGEFKIFVKKVEEMFQKTVVPKENNEPVFESVDINSLYGNDKNIEITQSEFTL